MATHSVRNTAAALDDVRPKVWSLKTSLANRGFYEDEFPLPWFPVAGAPLSVGVLARRFSAAGAELRAFESGSGNVWAHLLRSTVIRELRARVRDPYAINQSMTGLCGPLSILMELARRRPARYVAMARELLEKGRITCPNGRVITAEAELRNEPVSSDVNSDGVTVTMPQADWMLAGTMRDDENIEEDVDDNANGLETITLWFAERAWARDMIGMADADYFTCFWGGEVDCMKKAQNAVNSGGAAFLLIDSNMISDDDSDDDTEENLYFSAVSRLEGQVARYYTERHSEDDCPPPDHWVVYLGGLKLGSDPGDDDAVRFQVWSWGKVYTVRGTVDAFSEYLYAVVIGH